jgi:hypothetical protein
MGKNRSSGKTGRYESNKQVSKGTLPHDFTRRKILNWSYCVHCGLLLLNNDVTRYRASQPCRYAGEE